MQADELMELTNELFITQCVTELTMTNIIDLIFIDNEDQILMILSNHKLVILTTNDFDVVNSIINIVYIGV